MCPVVLLALLFSFLLLLLEITAAINVTFNLPSLKISEEEVKPVYFSLTDKSLTEPDEGIYRIISQDESIASVSNSTFVKGDIHLNSSFLVRGNFLGKTSIRVVKSVNGTIKDKSQLLPVSVVRKVKEISKVFTISVAVLVSLNYINMGCALDLNVVASVLKKPIAPAIGFFSQYAIMPLVSTLNQNKFIILFSFCSHSKLYCFVKYINNGLFFKNLILPLRCYIVSAQEILVIKEFV